jgi:hypothetical protein
MRFTRPVEPKLKAGAGFRPERKDRPTKGQPRISRLVQLGRLAGYAARASFPRCRGDGGGALSHPVARGSQGFCWWVRAEAVARAASMASRSRRRRGTLDPSAEASRRRVYRESLRIARWRYRGINDGGVVPSVRRIAIASDCARSVRVHKPDRHIPSGPGGHDARAHSVRTSLSARIFIVGAVRDAGLRVRLHRYVPRRLQPPVVFQTRRLRHNHMRRLRPTAGGRSRAAPARARRRRR